MPGLLVGGTKESLEKALEGRRRKLEEGRQKYRRDFLDTGYWEDLAREFGVRLPYWHIGPTTGNMERWLKRVGITREEYLEISGERNLREFGKSNPDWPLRAWVGILLEYRKITKEMSQGDE